ncbi:MULTISPECIES: DegT/DnrJ/EryC1/StrS family aminotransferase [Bacillus]|uniref:DegT/DnrJ/EryC1/StrS family aminotransferase n=1 Tax=Bacillus sp. BS1807G30 TaxID=3153756 RepID=A0AAU7FHW2_9BACI|nr:MULTISPECIES: DegT/DnrJ/EryC1/StrS family aminotransferase [Bacillus]MCA1019133.1 DegT/DnrJ/EryC1/StrS family aminotransferase [Bacillus stratosphericus]UJM27263.1 DegT/DnrJ/EryC1/StrS family aminotransferase [Bacillus aerophilus]CVN10831.1 capsular polysaccharide biosynthesis protein [Streptococcus pneumoniae]HCO81328.1 DegT/DnrJ/EryC1/StrS family aminotransferase [Bacillus sp. (in: firmicutes)]KWZ66566.1 aminotransferase [Bacillus altitudinis]
MIRQFKFQTPIHVTKPKLPKLEYYTDKIKSIWENKWLTNDGPLHEEFKKNLQEYLGAPQIELFTNGHLALEIALKTIEEKGEVITTPFTFASTVHAIKNTGFQPVFCDIEPNTFNININHIEKLITEKTKAIVAVHVFGNPCDVNELDRISRDYGIPVIYDAAHAFGIKINGKPIAEFGYASMFSMHATKVFHSIEGGVLCFKQKGLIQQLKALKNFGITSNETVDYIGINAKMNEFQAAMGLVNLEEIDQDIITRKKIYHQYEEKLSEIPGINVVAIDDNVHHNYSYFPIILENQEMRDYVNEELKAYNLFTRKYFYPLCNDFGCYTFDSSETPVAVYVSNRILALPMYTELSLSEVEQICTIMKIVLDNFHNQVNIRMTNQVGELSNESV